MKKPLQIRITKQSTLIPEIYGSVYKYDVMQSVSQNEDGEMVYWIHHIGNHFAIEGYMCEVIREVEA